MEEDLFIYLFILFFWLVCWPQLCQQTHPEKRKKKGIIFKRSGVSKLDR
jgi:hypothetical protein